MKPTRIFATAICLAALFTPPASAGKVYPAWVIPESLNVRSGPGTDRDLIGHLTRGTKVYVTAFANNWCWARLPDGSWGWIAEWLLQFSAEKGRQLAQQAGLSTASSSSSSGSSAPPAWVSAEGNVNVRSGPGTHYDSRGQIPRGTKVYIIGEQRGWLRCRTPGGYGWIRGDLLERDVERGRRLAAGITSSHTIQSTSVSTAKAYVNGDGVRLRSGPGTNYHIKARLVAGQVLYVTERRGEWVRCQVHGGQDGWIHSSLVKFEQGAGAGTTGSGASSATAKGYVNGDTVHLRAGPSLNERIKARVVRGQVLYITERQGDWCHVRVHGGEEGWIHASLVKLEGGESTAGGAASAHVPSSTATTSGTSMQPIPAWIAEDVVNVRYGPGTDHDIKFRLSAGTAVEVLELSGHWCKIRDGEGNVGWVAGWVMNFKGPDEAPTVREGDEEIAVRTAWVARPEVNIRSGPGTSYDEIAEAVLGTEVIILDRDGDWYRVALDNGTTGYMASWLLDTRAQRRARQAQSVPTGSAATSAPSSFGRAVVQTAMRYLGYSYRRGTAGPNTFDCSGFVHFVLGKHGVNVSRSSRTQFREGTPVSRENLQIGDVVFFKNTYRSGISHVGIYIGNGQFIHASNSRGGVKISDLDSAYYAPRWAGARRMH